MLKTKFVSSQIKAFIDDKIDSFTELSTGSALLGEKYSFDFSYLDRWIDILDRVGIEYIEISHLFHQKPVEYAAKVYATVDGEDWVCAGDTFIVYPDSDGNALESIRIMTMEEAFQDIRAMELCEEYYSHDEVVKAMEEELGTPITFERCAHSEEEMLKVRNRINQMIAEKVSGNSNLQ